MKVVQFPGVRTVEDWTGEIDHALDPLRAVLLDASKHLNTDQRIDLCARASGAFASAAEVLTDGISVEHQISVLDHLTLTGGALPPRGAAQEDSMTSPEILKARQETARQRPEAALVRELLARHIALSPRADTPRRGSLQEGGNSPPPSIFPEEE